MEESTVTAAAALTKAKSKRDKILKNVQYYKSVLRKWEAAVAKVEGRKPGKNDLKTAPEPVQKAYKEYYKLMKYLQSSSSSSFSIRSPGKRSVTSKGPSPKKIFFRNDNNHKVTASTSAKTPKSPKTKKSGGILKNQQQKSSSSKSNPDYVGGVNFNIFKEKISFVVNVLGKKSPLKEHKTVQVEDSEIGEQVTRKVLVPNRFAKNPSLGASSLSMGSQPSTLSDIDNSNNSNKECQSMDETDEIRIPSKKNGESQISKLNSVSIWQNLSPKPKGKQIRSDVPKQINSGWLDRCHTPKKYNEKDEESEPIEIDLPLDDSQFEEKEEGPTSTTLTDTKPLFSKKFEQFLINTTSDIEKNTSLEMDTVDSGLGMSNFVFNSEDILDIINNEILPSSNTTTSETNIFHNENACSPHAKNYNTIDMNAMGDLLSSNPFSIATSSNRIESSSDDAESCRKRKASFAFSPSPKKPSPKKKFFKTSRDRAKYSVRSYKPPTPSKKRETRSNTATSLSNTKKDKSRTATVAASPGPSTTLAVSKTSSNTLKIRDPSDNPATSTLQKSRQAKISKVDYFDEQGPSSYAASGKPIRKERRIAARQKAKLKSRQANENFLKIDITKKVFVRGHKKISGAKVKRNDWKMKKSAASKEDKLKSFVCRKCGEAGHFQKFCLKGTIQTEEPQEIDDSPFPSLEEAAIMAHTKNDSKSHRVNIYETSIQNANNSEEMKKVDDEIETLNVPHPIPSLPVQPYALSEAGLMSQDEEDVVLEETIKKFGFENFRPGQKEAVSRILKGLSTLCILSTGSGKSLCYQLPAFLYAQKYPGAMAICVSPLVSLMEDQIQGIAPFLQAACLHSNMSSGQRDKVLERIRMKKLHVLLVSPEAVCGGLFGIFRSNDLPQISFACIDEVHCVSQWSHNFRPCYLQLAKILREKLKVTTILGLTATATQYTANSICQTLQIDPSTTIRGEIVPCNLNLSASRDSYREEALLTLLNGDRLRDCESIIIYCTRRDECQRIATLIRTTVQGVSGRAGEINHINHRQRVSTACECYHAGMSPAKRRLVQQQFMSGKIRIVVATVAFGMGIDKSDIRAVIHYNMPKTFESYVQEIGRAGRDGLPAHCHLFLDNVKGRDLSELKRHVYCNSIDRPTLRKLLRRVFQPCKCKRIADLSNIKGQSTSQNTNIRQRCPGHEVSFKIEETVHDLDLPQENITTLLCYLELDERKKWIEMLPHTYQTCKIHSYGGPALLKATALKCPPLAAAIAIKKEKKQFKDTDVYLEFNVIEVSSTLGWNSSAVKKELKNLEWTGTNFNNQGNAEKFRKSGILVEFTDLAFRVTAPGDLTDEESDMVLEYLYNHNQEQEKTQLYQLNRVYQALFSISYNTVESVCEKLDEEKSESLKKFIRGYFTQDSLSVPSDWENEVAYAENQEEEIKRDIRDLLSSVKDASFTGRSIARILQGIPSPCFPAEEWARNRAFWRKRIGCDFHYLCKIAGQEILQF